MPGPAPKPSHLKVLQGNPGKRPLNKKEPKPEGDLKTAPSWLSVSQKAIWRHAIKSAPAGLLKKLDREVLQVWVIAADVHRQAAEEQQSWDKDASRRLLDFTPNGMLVQSPYLQIMNKQASIMMKAGAEMGFSPSSRSRVTVEKPKDADDPYADF